MQRGTRPPLRSAGVASKTPCSASLRVATTMGPGGPSTGWPLVINTCMAKGPQLYLSPRVRVPLFGTSDEEGCHCTQAALSKLLNSIC